MFSNSEQLFEFIDKADSPLMDQIFEGAVADICLYEDNYIIKALDSYVGMLESGKIDEKFEEHLSTVMVPYFSNTAEIYEDSILSELTRPQRSYLRQVKIGTKNKVRKVGLEAKHNQSRKKRERSDIDYGLKHMDAENKIRRDRSMQQKIDDNWRQATIVDKKLNAAYKDKQNRRIKREAYNKKGFAEKMGIAATSAKEKLGAAATSAKEKLGTALSNAAFDAKFKGRGFLKSMRHKYGPKALANKIKRGYQSASKWAQNTKLGKTLTKAYAGGMLKLAQAKQNVATKNAKAAQKYAEKGEALMNRAS